MPSIKKSVSLSISVIFALSPFIVFWQRQNLYDWWRLQNYDPPSNVVSLAQETTMDEYAKKIFYVTHPQLQSRELFRENCTIYEKTIVLGCYRSGVGIFLYDVDDPRLVGVEQVTSAHEMLHAAYDRLSSKERKRVDAMTNKAFSLLTDERVIKNVESYRSRDASVVPNELHSILATEVRSLPADLEEYYNKYFTNRAKLVGFSELYEAEFTNRERAVANYDEQLKALNVTITDLNASLDAQGKVIESENVRLERLLAQQNIPAYNAGVPGYQQIVQRYNSDVAALKAAIKNYNEIVDVRNSVVTEEQELKNAIDSSVPTTR